MKKHLLVSLYALLCSVVPALAYNVQINVDHAANVEVTTGNGATTLSLSDGTKSFELSSSESPLAIKALGSATVSQVTKETNGITQQVTASGDGVYRVGIDGDMTVNIVTSASVAPDKTYNVFFSPSILGAVSVSCNGEKTVIIDYAYYSFPADADLVIAPEEGYEITGVSKLFSTVTDNGDGTWTVKNDTDYASVTVNVVEKGIHFDVDVNAPSNVSIVATLEEASEVNVGTTLGDSEFKDAVTKTIELSGVGPYQATTPEGTLYLNFYSQGTIKGITRVSADGTATALIQSAYVGWRSEVSEGDTFVVDVTGPTVDVTFLGDRGLDVSDFVVSSGANVIDVTAENPTAGLHVGETITVAGANGVEATGLWGLESTCRQSSSNLKVVSTTILGSGYIYLYGYSKSDTEIVVDNAAAVTITGGAGFGERITVTNGVNKVENPQNPLKIAPADGYRIESVYLDGVPVALNTDGTCNAELSAKGTLVVFTAELPKPLPITFSVVGTEDNPGSRLIITKDGDPVEFTQLMAVSPGIEITVGVQPGWLIKDFSLSSGEKFSYDESTGIYTFAPRKATTVSIVVEKWVAAEGNALVVFTPDNYLRVDAILLDDEGKEAGWLKSGINEVKIGSTVQVKAFGSKSVLEKVLVNGNAIEISADGKSASFTVEGETALDVTTGTLCAISGYKSSNPTNYSPIGYIYINEPGQLTANVAVGSTFTILPTPARCYKFDGFKFIYPEEFKAQIGDEIKDSYTVTIPEGVDDIVLEGIFSPSGEGTVFTVRGDNCFVDSWDNISDDFRVYVDYNGELLGEVNAFEGETFTLRVSGRSQGKIETYCLYHYKQRRISPDYVVNSEDASPDNVIYVSAYISTTSGVEGLHEDSALSYDRAGKILHAPADVKVFSTSGRLVLSAGAGEISLDTLPAGVYIATSGSSTIKIVK